MLLISILLLTFLAAALLAIILRGLIGAERDRLKQRLDDIARPAASSNVSLAEAELEGDWRERLARPVLSRLAGVGARLTPVGTAARLRQALIRAGGPCTPAEFAGLRVLSVALGLGVAGACCLWVVAPGGRVLLLLLSGVIGFAVPDSLLEQAVRRRQALIRRALPDTIDLLVVSVEAGLGLDAALAKVTDKMRGPLSEELTRARQEMGLGRTRAASLKDMAARLEIGEVKTFVAALTQAERRGTSLGRTLRAQSESARAARVQRVREQAARLPVTLLFPLVLFVFPAIFVVLLGPSLVRLMQALGK